MAADEAVFRYDLDHEYWRRLWRSVEVNTRQRPAETAVADSDGSLTWSQLVELVAIIGDGLGKGVTTGPVFVYLPSSTSYVAALLAAIRLGRQSLCDGVSISRDEFAGLLASSGATEILTSESYVDRIGGVAQSRGVRCLTIEECLSSRSSMMAKPGEVEPAGVLHLTSGSSGCRDIVDRGLPNLITEGEGVASAMELAASDRVLATSPAYHSWASGVLFASLLRGAAFVTIEPLTAPSLFAAVRTYRPTVLTGVPYVYQLLAMVEGADRLPFAQLRLALSGGAFLDDSWNVRASKVIGCTVGQEYGLSEGGITTINVSRRDLKPASVGQPIPGVTLEIVDPESPGRKLGRGETGEVVVRRPHSPVTYLGGSGAAADTFIGGDAVRTGDLGYLDSDGDLFLIGRRKLMINVAGISVAPREVEEVLMSHPGVRDAVVVPEADPVLGEVVAAFVHADADVGVTDLIHHCRRSLSAHKVPRSVRMVDGFPRTASGKINRARLVELMQEPPRPGDGS